ncbi:magnesium chelatase subunit H [Rubrimonas sp.]|uniref:magnesium chelatase subunit H n=1 Tax=Rubrimonas sp. TaxID=2036015 RepID=UPI002FDED42F
MQKPISRAEAAPRLSVAIVTLDGHLTASVARAQAELAREAPGLSVSLHAASEWAAEPEALAACKADIARADIVVACMMFMDDHIRAILPALQARREHCRAMFCCLSAGEVVKLTKAGRLDMSVEQTGPLALLKRLRGKPKAGGSSGAGQMAMLRRLPKILKWIPGKAQDLRAYFLTMQYFLSGSDENIANMLRFLVGRYGGLDTGTAPAADPVDYPEIALYHPAVKGRITENAADLPAKGTAGTVGLLVMRSYVLANDSRHYDGAIAALEAQGLNVLPAFSSGLDARPAVEKFFMKDGRPVVDAVVSLTGFSLVGGPAYNDSGAAEKLLGALDVPYLAAHALEFQTLEAWRTGARGLTPIESTIMVAIPELDGATSPTVFGGRSCGVGRCEGCDRRCDFSGGAGARDMNACIERAEMLAARVARLVRLRRTARADKRVAITLFNFPPNAGATGTAAFLSVFESLFNTLKSLKAAGYTLDVPASVDALRDRVLGGNSGQFGQDANVHARVSADTHVRRARHLAQIEAAWGPAPGRQLSDGRDIFILGAQFGNVFVGVQPGFGYEGDPMRLMFEGGLAPTHAFYAYYQWLREDFDAHAVLHFGTHGALEFMPGKQVGLDGDSWPDRLIGDLPNLYLYAANNPSEGTLAKRRAAATLISYITPPLATAGLYRGLIDLKSSLDRWRAAPPEAVAERAQLAELIQAQAAAVDLAPSEPAWDAPETEIGALTTRILELEYELIPHGLHIVGEAPSVVERAEMLEAIAEAASGVRPPHAALLALADGASPEQAARRAGGPVDLDMLRRLADTARMLGEDHESPAILAALDGRFIRPAPGGDLLRAPDVLPTGRNLHGFDPFRIPSAYAMKDGAQQAARLIARHVESGGQPPRTVALVLWGADNLKTEGGPMAQALALMGARPRIDGYGRVCGAELVPLAELGRPRIDVMATLSGIFRDLLPLQTKMLAEAAYLASEADEPLEMNYIRANTLAHMAERGCDLETAALRVFSNADGAYGANVNQLVDSGAWDDEDELADAYQKRKCFAYGRDGVPAAQPELLQSVLAKVDLAYQNLESVELGVTTIDHYFDTLGGIGRAVKRARGEAAPTYIGDQTRGAGQVRTLSEQVALETRTRMLNPKWYEGMLKHGHEGVRQIEASITNTVGWSATTGAVDPWVYQRVTETFVLDEAMRERLAALNPKASARLANRLIEAHERQYWAPDPETLDALRRAGEELEDRLEGVGPATNVAAE